MIKECGASLVVIITCDSLKFGEQLARFTNVIAGHQAIALNQLEKDREPILITQHGVPSAYLVDVETFETLQRRMALLEGIARGEKAIEEGRSLTHKQAKQRMSRWLK